jgi:hypothetical protein
MQTPTLNSREITQGQLFVGKHELNLRSACNEIMGQYPYQYRLLSSHDSLKVDIGQDYGLIVYDHNFGAEALSINGEAIEPGFVAPVGPKFEIIGSGLCLLASHPKLGNEIRRFKRQRISDCKTVKKPWGYEIWMTGDSAETFVLKKIFLKAGSRTSLQYHQYKRETNFLYFGSAILHSAPDLRTSPEHCSSKDIFTQPLDSGSVVDVFPRAVHRLEAVTDICLYEISTPEVDDVIRIQDDSGRSDGRILSEHR